MLKKILIIVLILTAGTTLPGIIRGRTDDQGVRHCSNVWLAQGMATQGLEESKKIRKILKASETARYLFKVTKVYDGDTVRVAGRGLVFTVRLVGIDAPEIGYNGQPSQPYSQKARKKLAGLVEHRSVSLKSYGTGGYNRQLAEVFLNGKNINIEMIASGLAQVYGGRLPENLDQSKYKKAQAYAKQKLKGAWRLKKKYQSPWQWRKAHPRK